MNFKKARKTEHFVLRGFTSGFMPEFSQENKPLTD